jgi:AsmA protein
MKIFLWIVGSLLAALVLLSLAVSLLFDANSFRARISAEVDNSIHRQLTIGDIHVSLFPTLGARIKDAKLSNAPGFGEEPMAEVGEAEVGIRILPLLLHRRADISSITLKDLKLNLLKQADGKSNWDDLTSPEKPAQPPQPGQKPSVPPPQKQGGGELRIGGIDIDNANISYVDQQAKKSYALSKFKLKTGAVGRGKPFDFKLAFSAVLADPAVNADVEASAKFMFDETSKLFDARDLEASVAATGNAVPGGKQDLKLSGSVHFDGDKGTFKLADGKLSLANIVAAITLDGSGFDGDSGHVTGPLSIASFNPRETFKALGIEAPATADSAALQQASLSATIDSVKGDARLTGLTLKLDQSTLTGDARLLSPDSNGIQFTFKLDQIDADRYMAPASRNPVAPKGTAKPGEGDNTPLPLNKLDGITANGTLDIAKLKLKNLNLANAQVKVALAKGAQKNINLGASLYGGSLASATRIGPGARPTLAQTLKLASISAGPLLLDFMGKDYVSGTGNFALDVTSAGNTMSELKRALNGNVSFALQNGAVKGFNLAQIMRQGQAMYGGQQSEQSGSSQQTDFTTMSASGKISNGVLHSDDLNAASPLLRLSGAGQVDLVNSTLDYTAKPTVVNTATGQGGKELASLQGVVIPVRVSGPFSAPKYQIDVAAALQQEAVQKLTQKLGGQKGNDIVNTLQGLFGKKKQEPQPAPKP